MILLRNINKYTKYFMWKSTGTVPPVEDGTNNSMWHWCRNSVRPHSALLWRLIKMFKIFQNEILWRSVPTCYHVVDSYYSQSRLCFYGLSLSSQPYMTSSVVLYAETYRQQSSSRDAGPLQPWTCGATRCWQRYSAAESELCSACCYLQRRIFVMTSENRASRLVENS